MRQRVLHKIGNMLIRQRIVDVFALSPPDDQFLAPQHPEPLRNGRKALAAVLSKFRHARFRLCQCRQNAKPRYIAKGAKQARRFFQIFPVGRAEAPSRMVARLTCGFVHVPMRAQLLYRREILAAASPLQLNNCSTEE